MYALAVVALIAVIFVMSAAIDRYAGQVSKEVNEIAKVGAKIVAGMVAIVIGYFGKKLTTRSAVELLRKDTRPPVLYLRSFGVDDDQVREKLRGALLKEERLSVEEQMVADLGRVGPVVAIGRPGERLPTLGAARAYVSDADWQDVVTQLAAHAALVVLRIGNTPGFWWEFERAIALADRRRVVLFLPDDKHDAAARAAAYESFRSRAGALLPQPLPVRLDRDSVIGFDDGGSPVTYASMAAYVNTTLGPQPAPKPRRGFIVAKLPILDAVALGFLIPIGIIVIVWLVIITASRF